MKEIFVEHISSRYSRLKGVTAAHWYNIKISSVEIMPFLLLSVFVVSAITLCFTSLFSVLCFYIVFSI